VVSTVRMSMSTYIHTLIYIYEHKHRIKNVIPIIITLPDEIYLPAPVPICNATKSRDHAFYASLVSVGAESR
jgi:hypothetical protein